MSSFSYYDLLEMFEQPGCAVCRILQRDAHQMLDSILYERVTHPPTQNIFRACRGLCGEHGWQLTQFSNALGTAILYEQVAHEILTIMGEHSPGRVGQGIRRMFTQHPNAALADALEPTTVCPVCVMTDDAESRYLRLLTDHLGDAKLMGAYRASEGLCLGHFRQLLRVTEDIENSKSLINAQNVILERLRLDLLEFMRKNDYQHVSEAVKPNEANSWIRAVSRMGGERGVFNGRRKRN